MAIVAFGPSNLLAGRARIVRIGAYAATCLEEMSPADFERATTALWIVANRAKLLVTIWEGELTETLRFEENGVVVLLHTWGDFAAEGVTAFLIIVNDSDGGGDHRPSGPAGRVSVNSVGACTVWDSGEIRVVPPHWVAGFKGIERDLVACLFVTPEWVGPVTVRRAGDPPLRMIPLIQRFGRVRNSDLYDLCFTSTSSGWPASRALPIDSSVPVGAYEVKIRPSRNGGIDSPRPQQICAHLLRLGMGSGISKRALRRAAETIALNDRWSLARLDLCIDGGGGVSAQVAVAVLRPGPTERMLQFVSWVSRLGTPSEEATCDEASTHQRFGQSRRARILADSQLQLLALIERPDA